MSYPNTLIFVDLASDDPAAAGEFYAEVFGWENDPRPHGEFHRMVPGQNFLNPDGSQSTEADRATDAAQWAEHFGQDAFSNHVSNHARAANTASGVPRDVERSCGSPSVAIAILGGAACAGAVCAAGAACSLGPRVGEQPTRGGSGYARVYLRVLSARLSALFMNDGK